MSPGPVAVQGTLLELLIEWDRAQLHQMNATTTVGVDVLSHVQIRVGQGELTLSANCTAGTIYCAQAQPMRKAVPFQLDSTEADLSLHVYVDGSIVEVIANNRAPVSAIVAPRAGEDTVAIAGVVASRFDAWPLEPTVEF